MRRRRKRIQNHYDDHHARLLLENHRLYKVHAQRLAKLQMEYADLRMQMDQGELMGQLASTHEISHSPPVFIF
jgi:hypothetical protein